MLKNQIGPFSSLKWVERKFQRNLSLLLCDKDDDDDDDDDETDRLMYVLLTLIREKNKKKPKGYCTDGSLFFAIMSNYSIPWLINQYLFFFGLLIYRISVN